MEPELYPWAKTAKEIQFCMKNSISSQPKCTYRECDHPTKFLVNRYSIGCCKTHSQKIRALEKYGVENISQLDSIKEKKKKTIFQKYGVENPMQIEDVREKLKKTNNERYGCDYPLQNVDIHNKVKTSHFERYGVENPMQLEENVKRAVETNLRKYGVECVLNNPDIKKRAIQTNMTKYGVENYQCAGKEEWNTFCDKLVQTPNMLDGMSRLELDNIQEELGIVRTTFFSFLRKNGIHYDLYSGKSKYEYEIMECIKPYFNAVHGDRTQIHPYELDIYVPELKLAIEFNGTYWHGELRGKDSNYHLSKTEKCSEKDIKLVHIFEHEWIQRNEASRSLILSKLNIYDCELRAEECNIVNVCQSDADTFFEINSVLGKLDNCCYIGLEKDSELVYLVAITTNFQNKTDAAITRFTSKNNILVVGGMEKIIETFMWEYTPTRVFISVNRRFWNHQDFSHIAHTLLFNTTPEFYTLCENGEILSPNAKTTNKMIDKLWDCGYHILEMSFSKI